ncbi:hypothetical protein [Streptomyces sp. 7-21]|jgi:hypothetical protein|uniref:hypothetical protein n=1 Tax=Streptomyces sp. 7-21 TaxID=2802283 RepID=UPI00191E6592|nr:hypothetical protein [Streptomyces sp. 7-21]MBL1067913.1 hypothetical protein [Streptomyces sp. 7-21]
MTAALSPVIAATTRWLVTAFPAAGPAAGGTFRAALAHAQARQAVTAAAWLRYPTVMDASLVAMAGPGGSARLDELVGAGVLGPEPHEPAWRSWVDEVVASWAACLLASPALARTAAGRLSRSPHAAGLTHDFRRLTRPDDLDREAAALLRHPDLLDRVAALHRPSLLSCLAAEHCQAA